MTRPLTRNWFALLLAVAAIAPTPAQAKTPLKEATITTLRNRVRLKAKRSSTRSARTRDVLTPGDRLTTGRSSLAEFRFNDGTLARMGELALFRFVPQSRNFLLNQGTVLLLIPPGKGISRVVTPSIRAGIRGSALFVRHDEATNTTLVGALTNSGIEVSDHKTNQIQELKAGQMVVAVDGRIENLYDFDLKKFYETSAIAKGILKGEAKLPEVLQEIQEGLAFQAALAASESDGQGSPAITDPYFVRLSANRAEQKASTLSNSNSNSTASASDSAVSDSANSALGDGVASTTSDSIPESSIEIAPDGSLESDSLASETQVTEQASEQLPEDAFPASLDSASQDPLEDIAEDVAAFPGNAIGIPFEEMADKVRGDDADDRVIGDDFVGKDDDLAGDDLTGDDLTQGEDLGGDALAGEEDGLVNADAAEDGLAEGENGDDGLLGESLADVNNTDLAEGAGADDLAGFLDNKQNEQVGDTDD